MDRRVVKISDLEHTLRSVMAIQSCVVYHPGQKFIQNSLKTRLSLIESQPKKVVVVVVFVVGVMLVVVLIVVVVVIVVIVVGHRNLILKFGQNRVNDK